MSLLDDFRRRVRVIRSRLLWGCRFAGLGDWVDLGRCREVVNPGCVRMGSYIRITDGWFLADLAPSKPTGSPKIVIGDWCIIMHDFQVNAAVSVEIQDHVLCAARVLVTDSDHIVDPAGERTTLCTDLRSAPVVIEHDCWIGQNAVITKGVRVGHHSIVGANAVVTRNVPPFSIVGGIPARVIGHVGEPSPL